MARSVERKEKQGRLARFDWRLFGWLVAAGLLGVVLGVPYQIELIKIPEFTWQIALLNALVVNGTLVVIAVAIGVTLRERVGLEVFRPAAGSEESLGTYGLAVALGFVVAVGIVVLDTFVFGPLVQGDLLQSPVELGDTVPAWIGLLASASAGITEELLLRFGLVTLLVWVGWKITRDADGSPTDLGVWIAILLAAVLFGLGHLPATSAMYTITPAVVARAIVLNGLGGVIFGWLYWKRDLAAAMVAHISADVVLLVVLPAVTA